MECQIIVNWLILITMIIKVCFETRSLRWAQMCIFFFKIVILTENSFESSCAYLNFMLRIRYRSNSHN